MTEAQALREHVDQLLEDPTPNTTQAVLALQKAVHYVGDPHVVVGSVDHEGESIIGIYLDPADAHVAAAEEVDKYDRITVWRWTLDTSNVQPVEVGWRTSYPVGPIQATEPPTSRYGPMFIADSKLPPETGRTYEREEMCDTE